MKQRLTLLSLLLFTINFFGQENDSLSKTKLKIYGGFESNSQWYLNDKERKIDQPEDPLRSNNYLKLNANYGKFTAGLQVEAYEKNALLNLNPEYEKTNIATYFLNYKTTKLDVTLGYFYEQFGSGLILRTWEDRQLAINNSLRGAKIVYTPVDNIMLKALYGKQRTGFKVADSDIYGFDSEFGISELLKIGSFDLTTGFSFVLKDESIENYTNPKFDQYAKAFSGRLNFAKDNFYANFEHNIKTEQPLLVLNIVNENFIKPGSASIFNFGYSQKGFGFDATFRRMENMQFLSERTPTAYPQFESTSLNYNDRILNFTPALTKQHHSNLANIYVYQAQNAVSMQFDEQIQKFGEIGGQIDVFYELKKGSTLGGKYGTKVAINLANWYNLDADYKYIFQPGQIAEYETKFLKGKEKYFHDYNIEVSKKFSKSFKGQVMFSNQYYNDQYIRGIAQENVVKSNILFTEGVFSFQNYKALTIALEHMWADNDRGNWASMLVEYNHNKNFSFFVMDMYNYGFDENAHLISAVDLFDIHFYNFGGAYKTGSTRIALNYGRQRGGLVCAGGVCRFVPPSTGLGLSISTAF